MRNHSIRTVLLTLSAVGALTLVGCTPAEPELTPLPTASDEGASTETVETPAGTGTPTVADLPLTSAPPASEAEAIAQAELAVQLFLEVEADIINNHPDDTSALALIASEQAAESVEAAAAEVLSADMTRTGAQSFTSDDSMTAVSDEEETTPPVPYAYVELWGCLDASQVEFTSSTGEVTGVGDVTTISTWILVSYDSDAGAWMVTGQVPNPDGGPQC